MLAALHHVQLAMPADREAEARGFYGGLLGLDEIPKPPDLARRGGACFETGEVRVHLGVETPFRPAKKAHPAFLVHDLAGLRLRFDAAGQSYTPDDALPGFDRIYTEDPFGNRIELLQPESGPPAGE
ncbi:MAG: glyoxalase [Maritimibacter sp.]|nr:glyoxalase [Maritimibacter sp.]